MYKKTFILSIAAALSFCRMSFADESKTELFKYFIRHCVESSEENPLDRKMEGSIFNWEFKGKYKVIYADKKIFSYYTEELFYCGGMNGYFTVNSGSMYRKSNRKITLEDIAQTPVQKKKLLALIVEQTALRFKCSVKELPMKLLKMPQLTENFYLNDKGTTFVYNQYEIASKGAGAIKIFIPYTRFPVKIK